jgi:hypothetical protein
MNTRIKLIPLGALALVLFGRPAPALTFNFIPDPGTPQFVVDGFASAGSVWSAQLQDNITVNLNISWQSLPSGVIGAATPNYVELQYANVRSALLSTASSANDNQAYASLPSGPAYSRIINRTSDNPNGVNSPITYTHSLTPVQVTMANAKVLGLVAPGAAPDASIVFSSNTAWDFDPSNGTTAGQYDFITLCAHEIGHALGFVSAVDALDRAGGGLAADQIPSRLLDLFRFSTQSRTVGVGVTDVAADSRTKFLSLNGGTTALTPFASGVNFGTGFQASHWQEFQFAGYLMDPQLFPGVQRGVSATDLRAFDVMGYRIPEPGCGLLFLCGFWMVAKRVCRVARRNCVSPSAR